MSPRLLVCLSKEIKIFFVNWRHSQGVTFYICNYVAILHLLSPCIDSDKTIISSTIIFIESKLLVQFERIRYHFWGHNMMNVSGVTVLHWLDLISWYLHSNLILYPKIGGFMHFMCCIKFIFYAGPLIFH